MAQDTTDVNAINRPPITNLERGDDLIIDAARGVFTVTRLNTDTAGNLLTVALEQDDDEYKLRRRVDCHGTTHLEFGPTDGRRAVKSFTNVTDTKEIHDFEVISRYTNTEAAQ